MNTKEQYDLWLQGKGGLGGDDPPPAQSSVSATMSVFEEARVGLAAIIQPGTTNAGGRMIRHEGREQSDFQRRNEIQGVPIDETTGASKLTRFNLGMRRTQDNQQAYLEGKFGTGNVRMSDAGGWIVRKPDEQGNIVDVRVDPKGAEWGDVAGIAGAAPEIAGGVAGALATRSLPGGAARGFKGLTRDVLGGTAGAFGAGVATDVGVRLWDDQPLLPSEIMKNRTVLAGIDTGAGFAFWGLGRTAKKLWSPFGDSRPQAHFDALEAQKYFRETRDVDVPLSVFEASGSRIIGRTEMFLEKMIGGEKLGAFRTLKEDRLRQLQRTFLGDVPPDEELGQSVLSELRKQIGDSQAGLANVQGSIVNQAAQNINDTISKLSTPRRGLMDSQVGTAVRGKVTHLRDQAKTQADELYAIAKSLDGGTGKSLPIVGLADDAVAILDDLPKSKKTVQETTGLFDQHGRPLLRETDKEDVLGEFVPPSIIGKLNQLKGLKGQKMSLSELQQMRSEVYDDIAKGQAVPGLGTHYLNRIGKSLTQAIEDGIDALPNDSLKQALADANSFYKGNVIPFKKRGIAEMFLDDMTPGHIGDSELAARFLASGGKQADRLRTVKGILGEGSQEYRMLKGHIADSLILEARANADDLIDGQHLVKLMTKMRATNREVFEEVFGREGGKLIQAAERIGFAQGQTIPDSRLRAMLAQGSKGHYRELQLLQASYTKAKTDARNTILKAIDEGNPSGIQPSEFIDYFIGSGRIEDIRQVMNMLDGVPEIKEQVHRKAFEKLLRDAMRPATPGDIAAAASGDRTRLVKVEQLRNALGDPKRMEVWKTVLGDSYEDTIRYVRLETIGQARDEAFKAAGGIAAGAQISGMLAGSMARFIPRYIKNVIASITLTNPAVRNWASKMPAGDPGALGLLIMSPQFIHAATQEFGDESELNAFFDTIGNGMRRAVGVDAEKMLREGAGMLDVGGERPQFHDRAYYDQLLQQTGRAASPE